MSTPTPTPAAVVARDLHDVGISFTELELAAMLRSLAGRLRDTGAHPGTLSYEEIAILREAKRIIRRMRAMGAIQ